MLREPGKIDTSTTTEALSGADIRGRAALTTGALRFPPADPEYLLPGIPLHCLENFQVPGHTEVFSRKGDVIAVYPHGLPPLDLPKLDGVIVRSRISAIGSLKFGRLDDWVRLKEYPHRISDSFMEGGFVTAVKVYKDPPESGVEELISLLQLRDFSSGEIVWTCRKVISADRLAGLIVPSGRLLLCGYRLGPNGKMNFGRIKCWGYFGQEYEERFVEAELEAGVELLRGKDGRDCLVPRAFVTRTGICREDPSEGFEREVTFSQLRMKDCGGSLVWTWTETMSEKILSQLVSAYGEFILEKFRLSANNGLLVLGSETATGYGPEYSEREIRAELAPGKKVVIDEHGRPTLKDRGFVTRVQVFNKDPDEGISQDDTFSKLYSAESGDLLSTSRRIITTQRMRELGEHFPRMIAKDLRLDNGGYLSFGGETWIPGGDGRIAKFGRKYARRFVEVDIEEGFVARVRILKEDPREGVDVEVAFVQLRDLDTGCLVWTYHEQFNPERFAQFAGSHPRLLMTCNHLDSMGIFTAGNKSFCVSRKFHDYEFEAVLERGELSSVKFVWEEDGRTVRSRVGPAHGVLIRSLLPDEERFVLQLALSLKEKGLGDDFALGAAETLVRLHKYPLERLQHYGVLTQADMEAIIDCNCDDIDSGRLAHELENLKEGYERLGFNEAAVRRLFKTQMLPVGFLEYLQRTYRLGRATGPILRALRFGKSDVEFWLRHYRKVVDKRGTLDRAKHLREYDPDANQLLSGDRRREVVDRLQAHADIVDILAARQKMEFKYQEYARKVNGDYFFTLAEPSRELRPGDVFYTDDGSFSFQAVTVDGCYLTAEETGGSREILPKRGVLVFSPQDVSLKIQRQALREVIHGLRTSEGRSTGFPGIDRLLGLRKSVKATDVDSVSLDGFFDDRIPRHERGGEMCGDEAQEVAVKLAVEGGARQLVVRSPAGVGKTSTVVEIIRQFVRQGRRILIVSQMNQGVDNALSAFVDDEEVPALRLGNELAPSAEVNGTDKLWIHNPEGVAEFMRRAELRRRKGQRQAFVAAATSVGIETDRVFRRTWEEKDRVFDVIIMDEASRETLAGALVPLRYLAPNGRCIFIGDPKQLPPFWTQDDIDRLSAEGISREVYGPFYESILDQVADMGRADEVTLLTNWRQKPLLAGLISELFYDGDVHQRGWEDFNQDTLTLKVIDLGQEKAGEDDVYFEERVGSSYRNRKSAEDVLNLISRYQEKRSAALHEITIITPYRPQVELINRMLRGRYPGVFPEDLPHVTTIDSFQGGENRTIIIDMVRSNARGNIGFISDLRRLCVVLSRARENLAIVWDSRVFSREPGSVSASDAPARELLRRLKEYYEREVLSFFPED